MDLHNNEVGYQIGLDYGSNVSDEQLALAVWASIQKGNLKYLTNKNYQDVCFWGSGINCPTDNHGFTAQTEIACSDINCTDI